MSLDELIPVLKRDGFVMYISGPKERGKTDFGCLLAEICFLKDFRKKIATNIETESYMIEKQITNLPDLRKWLQEPKKKLFILDEAGLSIPKLRFMSGMNIEIMKILQMIRHYDAGFIGIAPSTKNIDSTFMNTDILDAHIKKLTKTVAHVRDYLQNESYFIEGIPRTSINFNSKHIAEFKMEKQIELSKLRQCCQIAHYYRLNHNYQLTGNIFNLDPTQVKRKLLEHLEHTELTVDDRPDGIRNHREQVDEAQSP